MPSPYEAALGGDLTGLHPQLRAYFTAIPAGRHGLGRGTFDRVGTPRRWLWPVLALLARDAVLFPVWEHDVPFLVVNRPGPDRVHAVRRFEFPAGSRDMIDVIGADAGGLADRLGRSGRLEARLDARIVDGALHLDSAGVYVHLAGRRVPVPRLCAPLVHLTERFDDGDQRQHVQVTVSLPFVGRVYEYSGSFRYSIEDA
ncbi:DUF4166 domain-containing protein [Cryobacterium zongtaii]|uniref:DUF4166 domain-containing protein n=1 Tax=Cryobacterium zongtaii TaxID=1259217 RepID=A0A2S3ZIJ1_9MICO|nr:DUF4166 domain-containing protein [Cryobacterium zongtaii]POH67411.1 DUF4166 domain-containing protein [Cryobacterium zongtaii]